MKLGGLFLLMLCVSSNLNAQGGGEMVQPSLDRLEIMIHREQFGEALQPLMRVETIDRQGRWEKLVERAAVVRQMVVPAV